MNFFLKENRMWSYVDGTSLKPIDKKDGKYEKDLETWEINNSKMLTWINNSFSQSIGMQLTKYDTAKDILDDLKHLYVTSNFGKQYQLKIDIQALKHNNMTI